MCLQKALGKTLPKDWQIEKSHGHNVGYKVVRLENNAISAPLWGNREPLTLSTWLKTKGHRNYRLNYLIYWNLFLDLKSAEKWQHELDYFSEIPSTIKTIYFRKPAQFGLVSFYNRHNLKSVIAKEIFILP